MRLFALWMMPIKVWYSHSDRVDLPIILRSITLVFSTLWGG